MRNPFSHPDESPEERAQRHVRRARIEMWCWVAFVVPYLVWLRESVAIVGLLSVYALIITAKSLKGASEAEVAGYTNPPMSEDDDEQNDDEHDD